MLKNTIFGDDASHRPSKRTSETQDRSKGASKYLRPDFRRALSTRLRLAGIPETKRDRSRGRVPPSPAIDPFRMHPTNMKPSHSFPPTTSSCESVAHVNSKSPEFVSTRRHGVENIDDKISPMIAATHELKSATEVSSSQGFEVSRIVDGISRAIKFGARYADVGNDGE